MFVLGSRRTVSLGFVDTFEESEIDGKALLELLCR
jgi:hypothetical protein